MNKRVFRATGAAAISETLAPTTAFQIEEIRLHLSAAGATPENLTVTLDSDAAAAYDARFLTQDMNAIQDVVWQPTRPLVFSNGDEIDIAYANTDTRTWGLEIYWSPIF